MEVIDHIERNLPRVIDWPHVGFEVSLLEAVDRVRSLRKVKELGLESFSHRPFFALLGLEFISFLRGGSSVLLP